MNERLQFRLVLLCLLMATAIFFIDLALPLGVAGGVPYIAVVLISVALPKKVHVLSMAVLCTALTIVALFGSPAGGEIFKILANRGLAIFAIWVAALLSLLHKEREREIERSQRQKAGILDSSLDAIICVDDGGRIIEFNKAAERIFGYSHEAALGSTLEELIIPASSRDAHAQAFEKVVTAKEPDLLGRRMEAKGCRADGTEIPIELTITSNQIAGRTILIAHIRDITERISKQDEHKRLATAIEQAAEAIMITDIGGAIEYVNPAFERISGYVMDEVRGKNPSILKSGKQDEETYVGLWETIMRGEAWSGVVTNRRKDGTLYDEDMSITPIRNSEGELSSFIAVKRDITRERGLEKQLRHAQKMEAIGTLTGGVAHDFNNILFAIRGFTNLARQTIDEESTAYPFLTEILKAERRAADLVKQMLTFSRQAEQDHRPLHLGPIIEESLKLLRSSLPSTIEICCTIDPECETVNADGTQLHQVIINLCTNAYHAMGQKGGVLTVTLDEVKLGENNGESTFSLKPGTYVRLTISDTGKGMDKETMGRIFEPFFTTKEVGEGTGLGLATVHGIVRSHHGAINVESEPGVGTQFYIYLPRCGRAEKVELPDAENEIPRGSGERILLVDDEEQIARLSKRILEKLGYTVIASVHPTDALELFRKAPDAFDLLITDLTMPRMNGLELATEIQRLNPDMPAILCTGYIDNIDSWGANDARIACIISKPADLFEMAQAIRSALRAPVAKEV